MACSVEKKIKKKLTELLSSSGLPGWIWGRRISLPLTLHILQTRGWEHARWGFVPLHESWYFCSTLTFIFFLFQYFFFPFSTVWRCLGAVCSIKCVLAAGCRLGYPKTPRGTPAIDLLLLLFLFLFFFFYVPSPKILGQFLSYLWGRNGSHRCLTSSRFKSPGFSVPSLHVRLREYSRCLLSCSPLLLSSFFVSNIKIFKWLCSFAFIPNLAIIFVPCVHYYHLSFHQFLWFF